MRYLTSNGTRGPSSLVHVYKASGANSDLFLLHTVVQSSGGRVVGGQAPAQLNGVVSHLAHRGDVRLGGGWKDGQRGTSKSKFMISF